MKTIVLFFIAIMFWMAGLRGNLGSLLAVLIDPASLQEDSATGSGGGTSSFGSPATSPAGLPAVPPTAPLRVNKVAFQKDSAQLNRDLTIGNFNPNIGAQWDALNASFALQRDVNSNAPRKTIQSDLDSLLKALNTLNDPMYNADYKKIYADLGF
jgi:hypothetical protein